MENIENPLLQISLLDMAIAAIKDAQREIAEGGRIMAGESLAGALEHIAEVQGTVNDY